MLFELKRESLGVFLKSGWGRDLRVVFIRWINVLEQACVVRDVRLEVDRF